MPASSVRELVAALVGALQKRPSEPVRVYGLRGSASALTLARVQRERPSPALVVLARGAEAEAFAAELRFFMGESVGDSPLQRRVHYLPAWEVPPFEPLSPGREVLAARTEGFHHLLETTNPVVVATAHAWAQRCMPRAEFARARGYLVAGETAEPGDLVERLVGWGYHRVPLVEEEGEVAARGGIVDVFPAGYRRPVRLEFVGDTVETIRAFDAAGQRSLDALEDVVLLPMREYALSHLGPAAARAVDERAAEIGLARQERRDLVEAVRSRLVVPGMELLLPYLYEAAGSLADYLPPGTVVWVQGVAEVETTLDAAWDEVQRHATSAAAEGRFHPPPERLYLDPAAAREGFAGRPRVHAEALEPLAEGVLEAATHSTESVALHTVPHAEGPLGAAVARLREWQGGGARLVLVATTAARRDRMRALLEGHGIEAAAPSASFEAALGLPGRGPIALVGELTRGAWLRADGLVLVTEGELFGEPHQVRRARRERAGSFLSTLAELKPDDFVVHVDHGIGLYRGLRHMLVAGTAGDYLHLEYLGGDRLYLPVDRINLVQRYMSGEGAAPSLDKLGGTSWERVKARTRESLLAMAHELVQIYAAREARERNPYGESDGMYGEFVARFPFEETPDQKRAIEDVLGDLARGKPMDRLVCGDVGFGKTEVAMRATLLVVLAGRQVAVLVPTTVLAQQHLETFRARFAGYPIVVEMVSRFRSAAENKATLARLAEGKVDVVIGTHRLLQKDVAFERLGLLVVDEEHRFGVRAKERIRQLRPTIDVLTLTATPIPRTLNMSLSGIRDLSVIETPPVDRLAIRTYVTKQEDGVIRDAILRELGRGGQVFFVHNRVATIDRTAQHLAELVPEAKIVVAHGQMQERALEQTMLRFMHGEVNVLVTSAIIESGLDIPTANTLIVNRADAFGLAQLYQLRGRIGRSHHRAYAYLLIPGEHLITPEAQQRLRVLQELDDLGGGFRLAAHDLEIRGAGNLLGKQQSGQIAAVGLELYTTMLEQAVREMKGEAVDVDVEPELQLGIPAFVPETYVPDESQRLLLYKRLAGIRGVPDLDAIGEELADRYGPVPAEVDTLMRLMELRRWLKDARVTRARQRGTVVLLEFHPSTPVRPEALADLVQRERARFRLVSGDALEVRPAATDHDGVIAELVALLRRLSAA
jgi:transcription-repair coupling factor (superfamily II helicase)